MDSPAQTLLNMSQKSRPIEKLNHLGKVIAEYTGVKEACKMNKISTVTAYAALRSGKPIKDYLYRYKDGKPAVTYEAPSKYHLPWENGNGMFDIDGWAKACF